MSAKGLVAVALSACFGAIGSAQPGRDLTRSPAAELVRSKCLTCHGADLIEQQRLTRAGWQRELDKMVRWGAAVTSDADRTLLLEYFSANFGLRPRPSAASTAVSDRGAEIFAQRCLVCHGGDIVEQQRLGRAGWTREIDKMNRWGAGVNEADKEPVVTYLEGRFGIR